MKLTNTVRDAFVRAVMDDVPEIDYGAQAQKIVIDLAVKQLPPKLKAVWDDKTIRDNIRVIGVYAIEGLPAFYVPGGKVKLTSAQTDNLRDLYAKRQDQGAARRELREKVSGVIYACNTLKQAEARLPEFIKYLPKDTESVTANLPAVANVVAELTKAGWPKGVKK